MAKPICNNNIQIYIIWLILLLYYYAGRLLCQTRSVRKEKNKVWNSDYLALHFFEENVLIYTITIKTLGVVGSEADF